jgi:hypothetical protein
MRVFTSLQEDASLESMVHIVGADEMAEEKEREAGRTKGGRSSIA